MRSFSVFVLFFSMLGSSLMAQDSLDELANSPGLAFEEDQSEPLVLFDRVGGFRLAPPADFKPTPRLTILPDGTVRAGADRPGVTPRNGRLTHDELIQLLDFIVNQNRFYEADSAAIKKAMKDAGDRIMIADALSSKFTVNLKRGSHAVEVYALQFNVEQYPEIPALRRLFAIEQRLNHQFALIQIGDEKLVQEVLTAVNRELEKKHPDRKPFQREEIAYAQRQQGGQMTVNFMRVIVDPETKKWKTRVNANYMKPDPDSEATVGLFIVDAK